MPAFLSNLANRQTDKRGQTHLPPPLSEVKRRRSSYCTAEAISRGLSATAELLVTTGGRVLFLVRYMHVDDVGRFAVLSVSPSATIA